MKQPKKLTREQKMKVSSKGLDAEPMRLVREDEDSLTLFHLRESAYYVVSKRKKGGYEKVESI